MTSFRYAAKKPGGQTIEGTIQAHDRGEAVAELRKQDLVVIKVEPIGGGLGSPAKKATKGLTPSKSRSRGGPSVKRSELVLFTRQLATMVSAGLALLESIDVLGEQAETKGLKEACARLGAELRAGSDLSSAMETCPKAFSQLYVSMVRAGEASGQMDVILERLADYLEAAAALSREIRSAMTYPAISMTLVLAITAFLVMGVVPTFRDVFDSLDAELPGITQFVLDVSDYSRANWHILVIGVFAIVTSVVLAKRTPRGKLVWDHILLKAPVFGPLFRKVSLARFSRTSATLIRSGVPIMAALDIVADTAGNQVVANVVTLSKESVRNGQMLSEPLSKSKVFPPMVTRMIAIGERTGALEALMDKIAEFYDSQVKAAVKALTSLIEPILITIMGVIVGGVVIAVFLPILDLVGKLSGKG